MPKPEDIVDLLGQEFSARPGVIRVYRIEADGTEVELFHQKLTSEELVRFTGQVIKITPLKIDEEGEGTLKVEPGEARVWQIWSEGYQATGGRAAAKFHGQYSAVTWDEAVKQWRDSLEDEYSRSCVSKISGGGWVYWGCRLFDNEADARRAFG